MDALRITAKDLIVNPDPARPAAKTQRGGRSAAKAQRRDEPTDADAPEESGETVDPETGEIISGMTVYTVGNGAGKANGSKGSGKSQGKAGAQVGQEAAEKDQLKPDWDHPDRILPRINRETKEEKGLLTAILRKESWNVLRFVR